MIAILAFVSCSGDRLVANKNVITEQRDVPGFEQVESAGAHDVHVRYGESFKVEVKGSSNLVAAFQTKVKGKALTLGYNGDVSIEDDDIEVFVTLPELTGVSLKGSGNIDVNGAFPEALTFTANITGSGDLRIGDRFNCSVLELEISGSGKAELSELEATRAKVKISGSGDSYVRVGEELDVNITGSGTVYYRGTPRVKSDINGSGQVIRQ